MTGPLVVGVFPHTNSFETTPRAKAVQLEEMEIPKPSGRREWPSGACCL